MSCEPTGDLAASQNVAVAPLDRALFVAPYIVIGEDNQRRHVLHSVVAAIQLLTTDALARSVVGTLGASAAGVDIDPFDAAGEPEAGAAVADDVVQWAERFGLPWLRRASGRDGHFHVIIRIPELLREELDTVVRDSGTRHNVSATVRRTLRLTAVRHRLGLPSPVLDGTLVTGDFAETTENDVGRPHPPRRRPSSTRRRHSRSEGEYGHALALARAGMGTEVAWFSASRSGSKAREIGRHAWCRWFWAPATTVVAAERRLPEDEAWALFESASPTQAAHLGRTRWRATRWRPALSEAHRERPRRRRLRPSTVFQPTLSADRASTVTATRCVLRRALERALPVRGIRMSSLAAALDALAEAIVYSDGAISVRSWAERARLDPKTVRRARDTAVQLGLIRRVREYRGGPTDSDHWMPAERLENLTRLSSSPTSPTTYTPIYGEADTETMRARHILDRAAWRQHLAERAQSVKMGAVAQDLQDSSEDEGPECREGAGHWRLLVRSSHCQQAHVHLWLRPPSAQSRAQARKPTLVSVPRGTRRRASDGRSLSEGHEECQHPP